MDDLLEKIQTGEIPLFKIPFKDRTYKICEAAVKREGELLKHVPDEHRNLHICSLAVENYGYAIQYVPDHIRSLDLYKKAVKDHPFSIQFIPEMDITEELCIIAVQKDWRVIKALPLHFQNQKIAALALMQFLKAERVNTPDFDSAYLSHTFFPRFRDLLSIFLKNTLDEKP